MARRAGSVNKAIEQGLKKRGVANDRADALYRLLLADGPMRPSEIVEQSGLTEWQVMGSNGALNHLIADGRVFAVRGHGNARMYYAVEEEEEEDA